jgi:UDP-N-acetylmuramate dehydrogenase
MKIRKNVKLAPYTTFKIGGAAKFFVEAKDEKDILEALEFAQEKNLPVFVLGGGSNVLVSDQGFEGVVIKIKDLRFKIYDLGIECGSGFSLSQSVSESVKDGLTGLEWAAGIPGTVGGAVRGNAGAGAYGGTMGEVVESVSVLDSKDLRFKIYDLRKCKFEYRSSIFKQNSNLIILSVKLKLRKGDKKKSQKLAREILAKRKKNHPEFSSPGSFFKNPVVKDRKLIKEFEIDTGKKIKGDKIPAGYLIDRVGLRGKKVGRAMISEKHANFIVNTGKATVDNVVTLVAMAKTRVRDKYGIQLEEEVQYVGF